MAGIAPPGTVVVAVSYDGAAVPGEIRLLDTGPRPGERCFAAYLTDPDATAGTSVTITAIDAAGLALDASTLEIPD